MVYMCVYVFFSLHGAVYGPVGAQSGFLIRLHAQLGKNGVRGKTPGKTRPSRSLDFFVESGFVEEFMVIKVVRIKRCSAVD